MENIVSKSTSKKNNGYLNNRPNRLQEQGIVKQEIDNISIVKSVNFSQTLLTK